MPKAADSTHFNTIVLLLYHAVLLNFGFGGKEMVRSNGVELKLFGERMATRHLCVGSSLTHYKQNKLKGAARCFVGAAIRVINRELYAQVKQTIAQCDGGFLRSDEDIATAGDRRNFLIDCPGCLSKSTWHGSCGACLSSPCELLADVKVFLSNHGPINVMCAHNFKYHQAA